MVEAKLVSLPRLVELARETATKAQSFTDPQTGTTEIRVLELKAIVDELIAWRRGGAR